MAIFISAKQLIEIIKVALDQNLSVQLYPGGAVDVMDADLNLIHEYYLQDSLHEEFFCPDDNASKK